MTWTKLSWPLWLRIQSLYVCTVVQWLLKSLVGIDVTLLTLMSAYATGLYALLVLAYHGLFIWCLMNGGFLTIAFFAVEFLCWWHPFLSLVSKILYGMPLDMSTFPTYLYLVTASMCFYNERIENNLFQNSTGLVRQPSLDPETKEYIVKDLLDDAFSAQGGALCFSRSEKYMHVACRLMDDPKCVVATVYKEPVGSYGICIQDVFPLIE